MSESSSPALGPTTHESPWGKSSGLSEHRFPDALSEAGQLGGLKGWKTSQEPTELTLCPTVAVYHTRMNTHAYSPTYTLSHTHIYSQTHPITRYLKHTLTLLHTHTYTPTRCYHILICVQLPHHLECAVLPRALAGGPGDHVAPHFLCHVTEEAAHPSPGDPRVQESNRWTSDT